MNTTRLEYLFELSMNQKASPDQMEEMSHLMALPEHEELVKNLLLKAYQTPKSEVDIDPGKMEAILQAIYQAAPLEKSLKLSAYRPFLYKASVAAAILISVTAGILFFTHRTELLPPASSSAKHTIVSGGNKALLTLADGSKVVLDDKHTGKVANQGAVLITKTADGQLTYSRAASAVPTDGYNIIETPRGGQYQVKLPDGTQVWLNAASRLKYPVAFKAGERRVELLGEAYFEVAKNKELPFRVVSNDQTVEVLGTHFNISSYPEEAIQRTTLLEGSVRISVLKNRAILKPGQQSQTSKNESIEVSEANTEAAVAWKNGYFRFDREGIESIMGKVSRWYDVNVEFKGGISEEKFNGTISRAKNINQVLEMLETTNAVHFKIEGRRILVMK